MCINKCVIEADYDQRIDKMWNTSISTEKRNKWNGAVCIQFDLLWQPLLLQAAWWPDAVNSQLVVDLISYTFSKSYDLSQNIPPRTGTYILLCKVFHYVHSLFKLKLASLSDIWSARGVYDVLSKVLHQWQYHCKALQTIVFQEDVEFLYIPKLRRMSHEVLYTPGSWDVRQGPPLLDLFGF